MNDKSAEPAFVATGSRLFAAWLSEQRASIAFTTYQAGKLFLIGCNANGSLSVFERTFDRAMGFCVADRRFWMGSCYQLWRFDDFLEPGATQAGYDALYVPTAGFTTGDVDTHDIHIDGGGEPVFVATRFNCIARLSETGSFRPIWRPPFIDRIAAEDRCHLNGLALVDGRPAYATAVSRTNVSESWREHRRSGGVVLWIDTDAVVAEGLSMPHSPRFHQGRLWLLQAGTGELGTIDLASGRFEPVCFLPGFARGLAFHGNHAVIGLSRPRREGAFEGLALNERLDSEGVSATCAICVVNLRTGDLEHRLEIRGVVQELYDVGMLANVRRPMMLGFRNDEIRFMIKHD